MTFSADLSGKKILLTGAGGTLGRHFAAILLKNGADVVLAGRREDVLKDLARALSNQTSGTAYPLVMDVVSPESIQKGFDRIDDLCGGINVVVNNAGKGETISSFSRQAKLWDETVQTNLTGPWLVMQEAARRLRQENREGNFINISSVLGVRVSRHVAAYAASKAALLHLTRSLALDFSPYNIRVNALVPGYIYSEMTAAYLETEEGKAMISRIPQQRLGKPEDLSGALLFLVSEASAYMTGASLVLDGGHLLSPL